MDGERKTFFTDVYAFAITIYEVSSFVLVSSELLMLMPEHRFSAESFHLKR